MRAKNVVNKKQWAVISPDGYVQWRTIADTRKEAKELSPTHREYGEVTWIDYEKSGFTVKKILINIKVL